MELLDSSGPQLAIPIRRFIWDLTYACPLRCIHCYSESGRRPARTLDRESMLRVVDTIIAAGPERVSFAGGEPLLVPWWDEAARLLNSAGIPVTIFISGWLMDEEMADKLTTSVTTVTVSVDGPDKETHDAIRGRIGSFDRAMAALDRLIRVKRQRMAGSETCYQLGVDYTVTRTGKRNIDDFVEKVTSRFAELDYVRIGAAMPVGLAQETQFVRSELLNDEELDALVDSELELMSRARNGVSVEVTDVRTFLPTSPDSIEGESIAQIEPDGALRAFAIYEAKVGNILDEPLDVLWDRAIAWRNDPFVLEQKSSIKTLDDWARVTRVLDRRYGSDEDKARIVRRNAVLRQSGSAARRDGS
ncbi:radical SAM protein [Actinoallomurus liliacearum]